MCTECSGREELLELRTALVDYFKGRRRALYKAALRNHRAAKRAVAAKFQRAAGAYLREIRQEVTRGLGALKAGQTPREAVEALADWDDLEKRGEAIFGKPVLDGITAGGVKIAGVRKQRHDPIGRRAVGYARWNSAKLVTEVTDETKKAIRLVIGRAVDYGWDMRTTGRAIRPLVGLTSRYAGAVSNRIARLYADGASIEEATRTAERYANKLLNARTYAIARTESARSTSYGILGAYADNGIEQVEWVADPEACEICAPNNGKVYTIKEAEGEIPLHPNCECTWVIAAGEKPAPMSETEAVESGGYLEGMPEGVEIPEALVAKEEQMIWDATWADGKEHCTVWDKTGRALLSKTGSHDEILFTDAEWLRFTDSPGAMLTHSHPLARRGVVASLSQKDYACARNSGMSGIRAVGDDSVAQIIFTTERRAHPDGVNAWRATWLDKPGREQAYREKALALNRAGMSLKEAENTVWAEYNTAAWRDAARAFGFKYTVKARMGGKLPAWAKE